MRATHEAQVMPSTGNVHSRPALRRAAGGVRVSAMRIDRILNAYTLRQVWRFQ
jgi:hypothetical protein